jgi:Ni/Co efflux regulator RcnB
MVRLLLPLCLVATAAPAMAQQATPASVTTAPQVRDLFERDWVLMNWALKFHDSDHDILIDDSEARAAADDFRKMADTNNDGRVTPEEYRAARAFILARY